MDTLIELWMALPVVIQIVIKIATKIESLFSLPNWTSSKNLKRIKIQSIYAHIVHVYSMN